MKKNLNILKTNNSLNHENTKSNALSEQNPIDLQSVKLVNKKDRFNLISSNRNASPKVNGQTIKCASITQIRECQVRNVWYLPNDLD